eukprot:TRINITY_DN1470_c0_g2_i1.p1 TRINITY_DN1470_c0_g2~~TRINITY_DN1470_c0_g2_i1.p1  ORF type:complete len:188 (+),score=36.57 TRINITY_DN1470_c0_g2_i1:42-566(+)
MDLDSLNQMTHHQQLMVSIEKTWMKRIEDLKEDKAQRETELEREVARLSDRFQNQVNENKKQVISLATSVHDFVSRHEHNGYTSVPNLLAFLKTLTGGLVDTSTDTPLGSDQPLPSIPVNPNITATTNQKRSLNSHVPKSAVHERTPAVKRRISTAICEEEDEDCQEVARFKAD